MKAKISYRKKWSKDGTTFDQTISITRRDFQYLCEFVRAEIAAGFPHAHGSHEFKLYLKPLTERLEGNLCFLNITQRDFLKNTLPFNLLDRNTCLKICNPGPAQVIIHVRGGVAYLIKGARGVHVTIMDFDNNN